MLQSKKYFAILFVTVFSAFSLYAQDDEDIPKLSFHRFSIGVSINKGSFFLQGNENGIELKAADLNRHKNSTKATTVGVGIDFNYRLIKQFDLIYDYTIEYGVEVLVDHYWIKSHNFGTKYRPISLGNFSPFIKMSYSTYSVGSISVHDPIGMSWSASSKGQYTWSGKGLTTALGMELKVKETIYYSLSYHKLFTIGNIEADEGAVVFENTPKHHYFSFAFRIEF